jgi:hypothetical protein
MTVPALFAVLLTLEYRGVGLLLPDITIDTVLQSINTQPGEWPHSEENDKKNN